MATEHRLEGAGLGGGRGWSRRTAGRGAALLLAVILSVLAGRLWLRRPAGYVARLPEAGLHGAGPFLRLDPLERARTPWAARFAWPLGNPAGALVCDARSFGQEKHLGSDLNGVGGWDSDRGDPVWAAADGLVVRTGSAPGDWGRIVILAHRLAGGRHVETFYGHLDEISVAVGQQVGRGQRIGTVGDGGGAWLPHLHFEVRATRSLVPGTGYGEDPGGRIDPLALLRDGDPGARLLPPPAAVEEKEGWLRWPGER